MEDNKPVENKKEIWKRWYFWVGIIFLLGVLGSQSEDPGQRPLTGPTNVPGEERKVETEPEEELDIDVSVKAYDPILLESTLHIKNDNSFDWSKCRMEINNKFVLENKEIFSTNTLKTRGYERNVTPVVLSDFTDKAGRRFDLGTHRVSELMVFCEKPYTGHFLGRM